MPTELLNLNLVPRHGIERRVFIKGIGFVGLGLLLSTLGGCESCVERIRNRPIRRRLRTGSAEVDAAIATYRNAVDAMNGLPGTDPRSWSAQAGIHGTVTGGFKFCQHGTNHFFSWHRAYLLYFERICQKLTGDETFGLPYWNWNQDPGIHAAFTAPGSPLSHPRINTSVAGNSAFSNATMDTIFSDTNFFTFSSQVEGSPHNTAHVVIGQDMVTGGSPLDPVFWAHHCMVDYCWAKWNIELGNDNTNDSGWANTSWNHFVDENGDPASATAGATTIMPLLSYQYESSAVGSAPARAAVAASEFRKLEKRLREGAEMRFEIKKRVRIAEQAHVSLGRPASFEARVSPGEFAALVQSDHRDERVFASIEWAELPPSNDFFVRVFLDLPSANANTSTDDPHYAGSFAFFGSQGDGGGGHHGKTDFLVNVTDALKRIGRTGAPSGRLSIQLVAVPVTGAFVKPNAQLTLKNVDLIVSPVVIRRPD
jgi:tyrosinase